MAWQNEYTQRGSTTHIRLKIETWGLLGFFWRKVVGENQIKEAPEQMKAFIYHARSL